MFLVYIDESGKPSYNDDENFVLAALVVNEREWQQVDNEMKRVKITYFPNLNDEQIELHAKEIVPGKGVFRALAPNQRESMLEEVFKAFQKTDSEIVASEINKRGLRKHIDLELWGYRFLFEKICWVLEQRNSALLSNSQPPEFGLLLIDAIEAKCDEQVRRKLLGFLRNGTHYMQNKFLIEDPLFVSSQYRNLSQLADLTAWTIRRKLRPSGGTYKDKVADKLWPYVKSRLHRNNNGEWFGIAIKRFP